MKIAFCTSEVVPFAKTGGMADVCGSLPLALEKIGQDIVIVMPGYGCVDRQRHNFVQIREDIWRTNIGRNIPVYLVENKKYFDRDGIYGDQHGDYPDNLERFDFFCRRSLDLFKDLKWPVDIVHCHDWQNALIPVYLKEKYRRDEFYKKTRAILSLHNLAYQGLCPADQYQKLPFDHRLYHEAFEFYGKLNLLKAGIIKADAVATVSPQYAREIQTKEFGCGLEGVLRARGESVIGILNGLDLNYWDPRRPGDIPFEYSAEDLSGKAKNKGALQKRLNLPVKPSVPVFGFVSRLSHQKGLDLINAAVEQVAGLDIQMVFLGVGENKYHKMLLSWAKAHPRKIAVILEFDEQFSRDIYAGSDLFLMPSVYEPCGLSQMISMRYGTIPVVYRVGGLADTVTPYDQGGNGFIFTDYTPESFFQCVEEAVSVYKKPKVFRSIMSEAFKANFSWESSARQYAGFYNQCIKNL